MSSTTAEDKRRRQNRESQRRYRKRQRMEFKNQSIDTMEHCQLRLPMDRDGVVPSCPSTTMWVDNPLDSRDTITSLSPQNCVTRDFLDVEGGETGPRPQSCDSTQTHQSMNVSSLPTADFLSVRPRTSEDGLTNTDPNPSHYMAKDQGTQQFDLVQTASTSRPGPTPSPSVLPFAAEGYNAQMLWNTPPASAHGTRTCVERITPVNARHENRSSRNSSRATARRTFLSTKPKINSRAVEMITEVERLCEFGVNIGILPESRDTRRLLNQMKCRFLALSSPPSTDNPDTTIEGSSDEDSDISS
ncbi:hypothetical protein F4680DRAFT_82815 [Xylaria scruposa]|nr:hypothetical protein F4680DRAFT_82815 [Xylaria scruposa]